MKWDTLLGSISGDIVSFIDDLRSSDFDEGTAWTIVRQYLSWIQYLGVQNTSRKTRLSVRDALSAWAGDVFKTSKDVVKVIVVLEKWEKARTLVDTF